MPDKPFEPKLGRIRDTKASKPQRYARRVLGEASRDTIRPLRRRGHIDNNALRRGQASGSVAASGSFAPGTRRVVVRARYVRQVNGDLGAARAHMRYIQRDGTARDGSPGQLYDATNDRADGAALLERSVDDPHQFRFIVSSEDAARITDLKPLIRDLMQQMEADLGTKLDWVAIDHFNTGHPHTHIVVRGKDERGEPLVMAREYIGYGIRARAQDLVTIELGPETALERHAKRANEIGHERLTSLDRTLRARAEDGVFVVSAVPGDDGARQTQLIGRLKTLESLGLATEKRRGVWALDDELEPKLKRLGERADKIKMMQRALTEIGYECAPGTLAIFDRASRKAPLTCKVVGTELIDEISDRSWLIVDATDGRVHYVELGRLKPDNVPPRGAVVRIVADRLEGRPQSTPRLDILARSSAPDQATHDGPVWLDRMVADGATGMQEHRGFGQELSRAIEARRAWLVQQDLGRARSDGGFDVRPSAAAELRRREVARLARELEIETGLRHAPAQNGTEVRGTLQRTIDSADNRYAVVVRDQSFHVVPWSKALERHRGREVVGVMTSHQLAIGAARVRRPPEVQR